MPRVDGAKLLHSIHVVPVGSIDRSVCVHLTALVSRHVALPCRFDDTRLGDELRLIPGREQADAGHLLVRLEQHTATPGTAVVGITESDLALPIFTHVFGGARSGGHTAAVSLARLKPEFYGLPADPELAFRRAVAEMLHEIGHLAGLRHCDDFGCLMRFCADVERIDLRGRTFCRQCAGELPVGLRAY